MIYILATITIGFAIAFLRMFRKHDKLFKKYKAQHAERWEISDILREATNRPDLGGVGMAKYLAARKRDLEKHLADQA